MAIKDTAATYIGLSNENEFYSHHYLSEVFTGDIRQTLDAWVAMEAQAKESYAQEAVSASNDEQKKAPYNGLKSLSRDYFTMREQMRRAVSGKVAANKRVALQRQFFQRLLTVLGYTYQPQNLVLEDNTEIPILGAVCSGNETDGEVIAPELVLLGACTRIGALGCLWNRPWIPRCGSVILVTP